MPDSAITPQDIQAVEPLTPLQKGMLFHTLADDDDAYVEQIAIRLDRMPERPAFDQAWQRAVAEVPALRSAFLPDQKPEPLRVVVKDAAFTITDQDARHTEPGTRDEYWSQFCQTDRTVGFALRKPPLMRLQILQFAEDDVRLLWSFHHLLLDGWSMPLLMRRVLSTYEALLEGGEPQLTAPPAYKHYRDWLSKRPSPEAFWRDTLAGFGPATPLADALGAPHNHATYTHRPDHGSNDATSTLEHRFDLTPSLTAQLRQFAEGAGLSLAGTLQAATALMLERLTGSKDFLIGTTVAGRPHDLPGADDMIGMFINTVPLRVRLPASTDLGQWLTGLMQGLAAIQDRPETPLHDVRVWGGFPADKPLFETIFVFENFPIDGAVGQAEQRLGIKQVESFEKTGYPLTVVVSGDESLRIRLLFDPAFFTAEQRASCADILSQCCAYLASQPDLTTPLSAVQTAPDLFPLESFSPLALPSVGLFGGGAALAPEVTASALSDALSGFGIFGFGVGLYLGRGVGFSAAVLGVCRAGGFYVPLDPEYPRERLAFMVADSGVKALVTDGAGRDELAALDLIGELPVLVLDETGALVDAEAWPTASLPDLATMTGDHPAYLCYTSGSTGQPKGALIPVRAVERLARDPAYARIQPGTRVAHLSSPSFDAVTFELWASWLNGGTVVTLDHAVISDPHALIQALDEQQVQVAFMTTALVNRLVAALAEDGSQDGAGDQPPRLHHLQQLLFGGEACDPAVIAQLNRRRPALELIQVYGPTEATTFATSWPVPADWPGDVDDSATFPPVPIGTPIPGTDAFVLDAQLRPVPPGVIGELWLGGPGLALGYHGQGALTADRFRPDPFGTTPGGRLYRTGDLVRWDETGALIFQGRVDHQVKLRGHRIELGEVEACLRRHAHVRDAVVQLLNPATDQAELVAWVERADPEATVDRRSLRQHLADSLPAIMRPTALILLDRLPLNANGKLDRAALPAPRPADRSAGTDAGTGIVVGAGTDTGTGSTSHQGRGSNSLAEVQAIVAGVWAQVLKLPASTPPHLHGQDSFFERGGHSLLVAQVVSRLRRLLHIDVPIRLLFETPQLTAFSQALHQRLKPHSLTLPPLCGEATTGMLWDWAWLPPAMPDDLGHSSTDISEATAKENAPTNATDTNPTERPAALAALSFGQDRLWVMEQLTPNNPAWHITLALELTGPLNRRALHGALNLIRSRHGVLRTRLVSEGGRAQQQLMPPTPVALAYEPLNGPLAIDQVSNEPLEPTALPPVLADRLAAFAHGAFDLAGGEALRALLLALPDEGAQPRHVLALSVHHIAADGWSLGILMQELGTLYQALDRALDQDADNITQEQATKIASQALAPLPALPVQYADFARWQRACLTGDNRAQLLAYWRQQLADAPVITLPQDRPRPATAEHRGDAIPCIIDAATTARLNQLAQDQGATLFMVLLAFYQATLSLYAGQDQVVTGSPVAGRTHEDTEALIGFFVNMLALKGDLSGDPDLPTLIDRTRQMTLGAYAHQELPFEAIVEALAPDRDPSHHPLFQVHFALQTAALDAPPMGDLAVRPLNPGIAWTRYDLECHLWEEADGAIRGSWLFDTALFDRPTIKAIQDQFLSLITHWTQHPNHSHGLTRAILGDRAWLPPAQTDDFGQGATDISGATADGNAPTTATNTNTIAKQAVPADTPVARFLGWVGRQADAVALVDGEQTLTYGVLCARAQAVARALAAQGLTPAATPEAPIGLMAQRGADLIIGMLGILLAGGRYVPLDPTYPADRLALMAHDASLAGLLTDGRDAIPAAIDNALGQHPTLTIADSYNDPRFTAPADPSDRPAIDPDALAYTLYTSGSTGTPKGVSITHGNVTSLLDACAADFALSPDDRWCLFHAYAFDFSVWEIWGALAHGGSLVIVPYTTSRDPQAFHQLLVDTQVTILNQTPTAFYNLIGASRQAQQQQLALRLVIFGGEALDPVRLAPWWQQHGTDHSGTEATGGPALINMYGITETTVHVTQHRLSPDHPTGPDSPIGTPIPSLTAHVLDHAMRPLPPGAPGELYVGGLGLARGYHNQPGLTAERFVPDPFSTTPGARLYRSGDRVRQRLDGSLAFLGRLDRQVQLRGHRIELGEIEAQLAAIPSVTRVLVHPQPIEAPDATPEGTADSAPQDQLIAYILDSHREAGRDADTSADSELGGDRDREPDTEHAPEDRIAQWQDIYNTTYGTKSDDTKADNTRPDPATHTDPAATDQPPIDPASITGWVSSFSGEPIPAQHMAEWRDATVTRIQSLLPPNPRILEIGCGTGMLLRALAPHAASYQGIDLAAPVIERLRTDAQAQGWDHVTLATGAAHQLDDLDLLPHQPVDLIIINSAIQYFPSAHYLRQVLTTAAKRLAPQGAFFLGDIRDLDRFPAFHAQIIQHNKIDHGRAGDHPRPNDHTRIATAHQAATAQAQDNELVINPAFFTTLNTQHNWHATPLLKRGHAPTEMNLYRYDLILRREAPTGMLGGGGRDAADGDAFTDNASVGGLGYDHAAGRSAVAPTILNAGDDPLALINALPPAPEPASEQAPITIITGITDPRLTGPQALAQWLAHSPMEANPTETLADAPLAETKSGPTPEDLIAAAQDRGYTAIATPHPGQPTRYNLALQPATNTTPLWQQLPTVSTSEPGQPLTNNPLRGTQRAQLEQRLRTQADTTLPAHMHPAHYVFIDTLPISPTGKLLPKNLPNPLTKTTNRTLIKPRSNTELLIHQAFTQTLNNQNICVTDTFFKAGGNSLDAIKLITTIKQKTNKQITLQNLFKLKSIQNIAQTLDEQTEENGDNAVSTCLIDLKPDGDAVPWFMAPPIGGSPLCYLPLSQTLAHDQPIYGLQTPGLWDGRTPYERVEDIAAVYLADIEQRFGRVPLRLAGWSFGGIMIFEMAQQAQKAGWAIEDLLIIDTAPMSTFDDSVFDDMPDELAFTAHILQVADPGGDDRNKRLEAMYHAAMASGKNLPPGLSLQQFNSLTRSLMTSQIAYRSYEPAPFPGSGRLVIARDNAQWDDHDYHTIWQPLLRDMTITLIPGEHNTLFDDENIATTTAVFTGLK